MWHDADSIMPKLTASHEDLLESYFLECAPVLVQAARLWAHAQLLWEPVPSSTLMLWPALLGSFWDEVIAIWATGDVNSSSRAAFHGCPALGLDSHPKRNPTGSRGRAEGPEPTDGKEAPVMWLRVEAAEEPAGPAGLQGKTLLFKAEILDRWSTRTYCMA